MNDLTTPHAIKPERFDDAAAAVKRLHGIYDASTARLRDAFQAYVGGKSPAARIRACYPQVTMTVTGFGRRDTLLSYGFVDRPGTSHGEEAMEQAGASDRPAIDVLAESDFVQRALEQIDDDLKLPFLCVVMEGYSCQETAELLKIPLGTVLSRLHRARQALRVLLGPDYARANPGSVSGKSAPAGDSAQFPVQRMETPSP